jgi:hypothetical protein
MPLIVSEDHELVNVDLTVNICKDIVDLHINTSLDEIMSYGDRLRRWAVIRLLENMQRITVARCTSESDADGYAQLFRRLIPDATFIVVFDPPDFEEGDRLGEQFCLGAENRF